LRLAAGRRRIIVCFLCGASGTWSACMEGYIMRVKCPNCNQAVVQAKNWEGPNFCSNCQTLFYLPEEPKLPPWILGVLVILVANWQIISR
jgi:hypothetical protein